MWATFSLLEAREQLDRAMRRRLSEDPPPENVERVRIPVALLFVRGDRAEPGKAIADQVVASFGYWNDDSSKYFDVVFPGWGRDGDTIAFDRSAFLDVRDEVELLSKWKYSGETDLLLIQFDYSLETKLGDFAFDEAIYLPVEVMVRDGRIPNLDALMNELVYEAKRTWPHPGDGSLWQMSGRMALHRGRQALWLWIKQKLLRDAGQVYDEVRPFVVVDLRR